MPCKFSLSSRETPWVSLSKLRELVMDREAGVL